MLVLESVLHRLIPMNSQIEAIKYLSQTTISEWRKDKVPKLAASLAYYTVFSIPPLLLIAMGIAGIFFGEEAARGQVFSQLSGLVGSGAAETVQEIIKNFEQRQNGRVAVIVGFLALLLGATGVFGELQDSLNQIWKVTPKKSKGFWGFLRKRWLSFGMILVFGFLLLVSLVLTSLLAAGLKYAGDSVPLVEVAWQAISELINFALVTFLFAAMFRFLPDAKTAWKDVWIGAVITAIFFTIGKFFISLYLGKSATVSAFGAAGSLILLFLWVYYSAQVFFLGAEFTYAYAMSYGSGVRNLPEKHTIIYHRNSTTEKLMALGTMTLFALFILLRARQKNKAPF